MAVSVQKLLFISFEGFSHTKKAAMAAFFSLFGIIEYSELSGSTGCLLQVLLSLPGSSVEQ
jgi:hypothetical protein